MLDDQKFNLESLARLAPTGIEGPPESKQIGTETFYYYGPGGGVAYADRYFLDVRGKTLGIAFEAEPNNNIPSPETRTIEKPLLQTFRSF